MIKLLIVCRGNTCRSPMAEYILTDMIVKAGQRKQIHVESAGTHNGSLLTSTVHEVLTAHEIKHDSKRRARSIDALQLEDFDQILVMDRSVQQDILAKIAESDNPVRERVMLFLGDTEVSDPYDGDRSIYEETYRIIHHRCAAIMRQINDTN